MSAVNRSSAGAAVSFPQPQPNLRAPPTAPRHEAPPYFDMNRVRAVEREALHKLALIEDHCRNSARGHHPLAALPRPESNIRSVKRFRHWRKEFESILTTEINAKSARCRELMAQIEYEEERGRQIKNATEQLRRQHEREPDLVDEREPDLIQEREPDLVQERELDLVQERELDLVQVDAISPDQKVMHEYIANLEAEQDTPTPVQTSEQLEFDPDFDAAFGALSIPLIQDKPFAEINDVCSQVSPTYEDNLEPNFLMSFPAQSSQDFTDSLMFNEDNAM